MTPRDTFARRRFVVLTSLLTTPAAAALAELHGDDGAWSPLSGHEGHAPAPEILRFFDDMGARVMDIAGQGGGFTPDCWVNRYRTGDFIFRHVDRVADTVAAPAVLNVCLAAPPRENGGDLVLALAGGGEVSLHLDAGDAVLFDGAHLEHWTTPIMATEDVPDPCRIVAVGRYYAR